MNGKFETSDIILKYLKKNNISIDSKKLVFRLKTHPKYPQLTSIIDTLNDFDINFDIYEASLEDLDTYKMALFLALLKNENNEIFLSLVEHKNEKYKLNSINIPKVDLKRKWKNIIIVIEKKDKPPIKKIKLIFFYSLIAAFLVLSFINLSILDFSFLSLNIIGFYLSLVALSIDLDLNTGIAKKICFFSKQNNCDSIIKSKKWKIFRLINFTDLSIAFFLVQTILFFTNKFYDNIDSFYLFQYLLLIFCSPLMFLSLYYQRYIERKICIICLGVISVIGMELMLMLFLDSTQIYNLYHFIFFIGIYILFLILWKHYKNIVVSNKILIESKMDYEHFLNDYSVFKAILTKGIKSDYKSDFLFFSKSDNNLTLTLVTDPFCEFCKDFHQQLNFILKYMEIDSYNLNIIFNIDITEEEKEDKLLYLTMLDIQNRRGNMFFFKELKEWYNHKDVNRWLLDHNILETKKSSEISHILSKQKAWCELNNINYTPALFINGYKLPNVYKIENLQYFMAYLVDDDF